MDCSLFSIYAVCHVFSNMQFIVMMCTTYFSVNMSSQLSDIPCVLHVLIENLLSLQYTWYFAMDACFDFNVVSILKNKKNYITTFKKMYILQ